MKKIRNIITIVVAFIALQSIAQELPTIIPPSPEARKIIEYGNVPVNYSTGVPNVSIPLYDLRINTKFSIPMSMSYHASGVRVDDDEGQVGLKWSLSNGGGRISRTINGRPDEENDYPNAGWFNMMYDLNNFGTEDLSESDKIKISNGCLDFQPDEFHFNLPNGVSGKFIFDGNKQPVLIPNDNSVKIDFFDDYTLNSGFKITDQQGNQYTFQTIEHNTFSMNCSGNFNTCTTDFYTPSSWMLDSVLLQNGDTISYSYSNDSYKESFVQSQSQILQTPLLYGDGSFNAPDWGLKSCNAINQYNIKLLEEISFKDTRVSFSYSNKPGGTVDSGKKLDNFKIYNKEKLRLGYQFNYSNSGRMFLNDIKQIASNDSLRDYYAFDYEGNGFPEKGSFSKDHFGYNNGKGNLKLIPGGRYKTPYVNPSCGRILEVSYSGANRELDAEKIKLGVLTKLTYPTKGWTEFEYEPNEAYFGKNETLKKRIFYTAVPNNTPYGWQTKYSNYFTTSNGKIEFNSFFVTMFDVVIPGLNWGRPNFQLIDDAGQVYYERTLNFLGENFQEGCSLKISVPENGNYRIKLNIYNSSEYVYNVRISGEASENVFTENKYYGGLRVSSIKNYDNDGSLASHREFSYQKFNNPNESSGKVLGKLTTYEDEYIESQVIYNPNSPQVRQQAFKKLVSNATQTLAYTRNSPVIYKNVLERFIGKNDEEYTIKRYFENEGINRPGRSIKTHNGTVHNRFTVEDYANGMLKKEEYFDAEGTMVKTTENSYQFLLDGTSDGVTGVTATCYTVGGIGEYICHVVGNQYLKRWFTTKTVTDTTFYDNRFITQSKENFFENPTHKQLTKTKTINSDGKQLSTYTYYPQDINTPTTVLQKLIDQHRIATPIEVKNTLKEGSSAEKLTSEVRNVYGDWGGNIIELQNVKVGKKEDVVEDRIVFFDYDDKGNPLEVSKSDGVHISYIWGYNKQYPVARIENATRAEIEALSGFGADFHTGVGGLSSGQENTLRTKLPNTMISTYEYEPLVGITKMTDPRGYTMTYHYDAFNRLEYVKDSAGKLISENEYNYKN